MSLRLYFDCNNKDVLAAFQNAVLDRTDCFCIWDGMTQQLDAETVKQIKQVAAEFPTVSVTSDEIA